MSKAFKCDHCHEFFGRSAGSHTLESEVLDAKHGYVRYRIKSFVFDSSGPSRDLYESDKELCASCVKKILLAALNGEKL